MAVLTIHHYLDIINSFVNNITSSYNSYYLYFGKQHAWLDGSGNETTVATTAAASISQHESQLYKDMAFGKLLQPQNVAFMIPRINWTSGDVYDFYDQDDGDLYNKNFYVMTNNYEVYKCIDNNYGAKSVVKPSLKSTSGTFGTSDGYIWKYMYTLDTAANAAFTTISYIPVNVDADVTENAVGGTIDTIRMTNRGNSYHTFYSGYLISTINDYNVVIDRGASPINGYYTGSSIYLKSGFGSGQIRKIKTYDGTNRIVTVDSPFEVYTTMQLKDISGTFNSGATLTQNVDVISYLYKQGIFHVGDNVIQSDSGANGTIIVSNDLQIKVVRNSGGTTFNILNPYPIVDTQQAGTLKAGNIRVSPFTALAISSNTGAFTVGEKIYQSNGTSNTANGFVFSATSSKILLTNTAGSWVSTYQTKGITSNSNAVITAVTSDNTGNTYVFANTGTSFVSEYAVGSYIRFGADANNNVRRVVTVNSSVISVDVPFNNSAISNVHYSIPYALRPDSISITSGNGYISNTNLNGSIIAFSNQSILGLSYITGEKITMVDISNTSQTVTGIVSFANNTNMVVSDIVGSGFVGGVTNTSIDLGYSSIAGSFTVGDIVADSSTGGVGTIGQLVTVSGITHMIVNNISGTFTVGDTLQKQGATNVTGSISSVYSTNFYIKGSSSLQRAHIDSVLSYPNITIKTQLGQFLPGQLVFARNSTTLNQEGTANLISYFPSLNEGTEYVISPTVTIDGDGIGAVAYAVVNNSIDVFYTGSNGSFNIGESITNLTGGATGIIYAANSTAIGVTPTQSEFRVSDYIVNRTGVSAIISGIGKVISGVSAEIYFSDITGTFIVGDIITESTTGAVGTVATVTDSYMLLKFNIGLFNPTNVFVNNKGTQATINKVVVSPHNIDSIKIVNAGSGYTSANIGVVANSNYGTGAIAKAIISPVAGHGGDTKAELGARYAGISINIDTGSNESYRFPITGSYRKVGILENPLFDDVTINLASNSFDRVKLQLSGTLSGSFETGEVVYQTNTHSAGLVVYSNSSFIELKNIKMPRGEFAFRSSYANGSVANDNIIGLSSRVVANVYQANISLFQAGIDKNQDGYVDIISETTSGANGRITYVISNTQLVLTGVSGKFTNSDVVSDSTTNSYANVISIFTSNGTIDSTATFGDRFNQLIRVPFTTASNPFFTNFEYIKQNGTLATGRVVDSSHNIDLVISNKTGTILTGDTVNNSINEARGRVIFANSTYLRLSEVSGTFSSGDSIVTTTASGTANVTSALSVVIMDDVSNGNRFSAGPLAGDYIGQTSGAICKNIINNTIVYPDLMIILLFSNHGHNLCLEYHLALLLQLEVVHLYI